MITCHALNLPSFQLHFGTTSSWSSRLISAHAGLAVDIKKSTYKNLAKLLKAFEKKV